MKITIRREEIKDRDLVFNLIKDAFKTASHSNADEQNLVNRLRISKDFIPELSLVAQVNEALVGHIMFTRAIINNSKEQYELLALAPLAVSPEYQRRGVGKKLIYEGLKLAEGLGFESVIVLGDNEYYGRFGFEEASIYNISAPFNVPSKNFMVKELKNGALKRVSGVVNYAKEFFV